MKRELTKSLQQNMQKLQEKLEIGKSFDVVERRLTVAGKEACLYFVDGFVKDDTMEKMMEFFQGLKPEALTENGLELKDTFVPYVEVTLMSVPEEIVTQILSGVSCLLIDGFEKCLAIDCRTYPVRSVSEPEKDKVLRGSRDGFVETLVFNTALIRRRIRSPRLTMEMLNAGEVSKTDIVLCYMDDRVDRELLSIVKNRIQNLKVDALTMNQESLAECLYRGRWFNPFPKFKYTERPDAAAAGVLEGKLAILVDNSPSAMLLPASIFDIMEEADDFYFPPVTGTYLRVTRFLIGLMTIFLTPLWLLFMQNPEWIPQGLSFILIQEEVHVPVIFQLLILELSIDGLKLAAINTPSSLTTPLSVIAAIVVGEFAVKSGWFNSETMLYMAFVALANYMQSSYELGYAFKFIRLLLLILTALLDVTGFGIGVILLLVFLGSNRTISGKSYLAPLIPFKKEQFIRRFFRKRIPHFYE